MKLERYKDKKETRKKVILIGLTVVTIVSVTMMLYKTFAKFTSTASFPIMSGKVKYKKKGKQFGTDIPEVKSGNGLYKVEHTGATGGWEKAEYRYAGSSVDNYVYFNCKNGITTQNNTNCEKWRIIGLVNVKINSGIEQRIKIIRNESIGGYPWDYGGSDGLATQNDWTQATLMGMLNDTYYNSLNENTYCYSGIAQIACNFEQSQLIRGLSSETRDIIESDNLSWNIGGLDSADVTANVMYENERGTVAYYNRENEWNITNTKDPVTGQLRADLFRGVGLMYPSDYGYAVGGDVRTTCLETFLSKYDTKSCYTNDWLVVENGYQSLITPSSSSPREVVAVTYDNSVIPYGYSGSPTLAIRPVVFLNSNIQIGEGSGSEADPYHLIFG